MTASARDARRAGHAATRAAAGAALLGLLAACGTAGVVPAGSPLESPPTFGAYVPDAADRAAHDAAAASLAGNADAAAAARGTLAGLEDVRRRRDQPPTGLLAPAAELESATLADPLERRRALRTLLARRDLTPEARARLEMESADDPLRLADQRLSDARQVRVARIFNALAEPIGRSLWNVTLAPYRLGRALVRIAVAEHVREPISVPERQALAHWKRFVETHPDAPESRALLDRIDGLQGRWYAMKRERNVRAAHEALEQDQPALALVLAERALRYAPEDREATGLWERASARLEQRRADLRRSVSAAPAPPADRDAGGALARAMLAGDDFRARAHELAEQDGDPALSDAARFAEAVALAGAGAESQGWSHLEVLAERDPEDSTMARHAAALLASPAQNPHAAHRRALAADRRRRGAWLLLGPLAGGAREQQLPRPVEWLIEAPTVVAALGGLPNRLVRAPWLPPTARAAAVHARTYLARFPEGEHAGALRRWLIDFESERGNWIAAYRLAAGAPNAEPDRVAKLREQAAGQALAAAGRQKRPDLRAALLREVAVRYPGTRAGDDAGRLARELLEQATAQRIRISRGFLEENPRVAGPAGLGLRAELLDSDPANGELHPEGVHLIGGRALEIALLDEEADPEAPPHRVRRVVSARRLARLVSLLDETALRNALVDPDASFEADADRERYFERARLGVTDRPDLRATARSSYAFLGMRERYGMVRRREPLLPVDLVVQGSLPDVGLGAFPRLRAPRPTPDAILYR